MFGYIKSYWHSCGYNPCICCAYCCFSCCFCFFNPKKQNNQIIEQKDINVRVESFEYATSSKGQQSHEQIALGEPKTKTSSSFGNQPKEPMVIEMYDTTTKILPILEQETKKKEKKELTHKIIAGNQKQTDLIIATSMPPIGSFESNSELITPVLDSNTPVSPMSPISQNFNHSPFDTAISPLSSKTSSSASPASPVFPIFPEQNLEMLTITEIDKTKKIEKEINPELTIITTDICDPPGMDDLKCSNGPHPTPTPISTQFPIPIPTPTPTPGITDISFLSLSIDVTLPTVKKSTSSKTLSPILSPVPDIKESIKPIIFQNPPSHSLISRDISKQSYEIDGKEIPKDSFSLLSTTPTVIGSFNIGSKETTGHNNLGTKQLVESGTFTSAKTDITSKSPKNIKYRFSHCAIPESAYTEQVTEILKKYRGPLIKSEAEEKDDEEKKKFWIFSRTVSDNNTNRSSYDNDNNSKKRGFFSRTLGSKSKRARDDMSIIKNKERKIKKDYDDIMSVPRCREKFIEYCKDSFCLENVLFIEHFIELRSLTSYDSVYKKSKNMFNEYLSDTTIFQINTTDSNRHIIKKIIRDEFIFPKGDKIDKVGNRKTIIDAFEKIALEIHHMMTIGTIKTFSASNSEFFI